MKTLTKLSVVAALASAAISYAGPGPQFWNRPATKTPSPKVETAAAVSQTPTKADSSGLTCARMLVPRIGAFKQSPVSVVTCTPEMMKSDWRCQQACAFAAKG
ncbi:MAG: hypothetical protein HZA93_08355 [Verrucomicrobia bacterium]|nr:hypothetical protein [Verrucomicrobiota bacterium]